MFIILQRYIGKNTFSLDTRMNILHVILDHKVNTKTIEWFLVLFFKSFLGHIIMWFRLDTDLVDWGRVILNLLLL